MGNLGQPPDTVDGPLQILPYLSQFNSPGLTAGQQFTTGATAATIREVFASLGNLDLGTSGGFHPDGGARIQDSTSMGNSIPGTLLTSFSYSLASIPTSGFANVEFDTSAITLMPSQLLVRPGGRQQLRPTNGDSPLRQRYLAVHPLSTNTYGPGQLPLSNQTFNNLWSNDPNSPELHASVPQRALPGADRCSRAERRGSGMRRLHRCAGSLALGPLASSCRLTEDRTVAPETGFFAAPPSPRL